MNAVNLHGAGDTDQTRGTRRAEQTAERNQAARQAPPSSPQESDAVEFSARGEQVLKLVARAQESHGVREERVEPLQQQVSSNSYYPPSSQIADAIIRDY